MVKLWDFETSKLKKVKKQFTKELILNKSKLNGNTYRRFLKKFDPEASTHKTTLKNLYMEFHNLITPSKTKKEYSNLIQYRVDATNIEKSGSWTHSHQISKVKKAISRGSELIHEVIFSKEYEASDDTPAFFNIKKNLTKAITDTTKKIWDDYIKWDVYPDSETGWIVDTYLNAHPKRYVIIKTYERKKVQYKPQVNFNQMQTFRDNIHNGCVYDAIKLYLENKMKVKEDANIQTMINKLNKHENKLRKGYTWDNMHEITDLLGVSITIKDLVNGKSYDIPTYKRARFNIEMINSRYNHLDLYLTNDSPIEVSQEDYDKIKNESVYYIEKYGVLYMYKNENQYGNYKIYETEFNKVYNEWKQTIKYNELSISTFSDEYLLISQYDNNTHRFFNNFDVNDNDYYELDLRSAYYNYSNKEYNPYYCGVPSGGFINIKCDNMTDEIFIEMTNNKLVGFFNVEILDNNLKSFGFFKGSYHVLFTSQVMLLLKHTTLKFLYASYSVGVDMPFNEKFLGLTEKGLKFYCKAYGLLFVDSSSTTFELKHSSTDNEYYSVIHNDDYDYFEKDKDDKSTTLKIVEHKKDRRSHRHIAFAIHAYCKTLILEKMISIGSDNIFGVKLDSIIVKNVCLINECEKFKIKKCNIVKLLSRESYDVERCKYFSKSNGKFFFNMSFLPNNEIVKNKIIYCHGMGGSGKTHSILSSNNINQSNLCYTTSAWRLIHEQKKKFEKIIGLSLPKLIGYCDNKKVEKTNNKNIRYIVIDEGTLIERLTVERIIKDYENCFIFILGDIDISGRAFQCSNTPYIFKDFDRCQNIEYTKTYRFNEELNNYLLELRQKMIKYDGNIILLKKYLIKTLSHRMFKADDIKYNNNDIGISCLKDNTLITEYFLNRGVEPKYFVKNTDLKNNVCKGQQYKEKPEGKNYEVKLFHTIHSFQGCQLEQDNNIIIYLDKLFDYNLIYTALSRARRIDQIFIIM